MILTLSPLHSTLQTVPSFGGFLSQLHSFPFLSLQTNQEDQSRNIQENIEKCDKTFSSSYIFINDKWSSLWCWNIFPFFAVVYSCKRARRTNQNLKACQYLQMTGATLGFSVSNNQLSPLNLTAFSQFFLWLPLYNCSRSIHLWKTKFFQRRVSSQVLEKSEFSAPLDIVWSLTQWQNTTSLKTKKILILSVELAEIRRKRESFWK